MFHSDRAGRRQECDQRPPATPEHMFLLIMGTFLPGCGTFIRTFFVTPTSGGQAPAPLRLTVRRGGLFMPILDRFASQRSQQPLPELFVRAMFVGLLATQIDSIFYQICPSPGCQSKRRCTHAASRSPRQPHPTASMPAALHK